jgi:hypothetical protein
VVEVLGLSYPIDALPSCASPVLGARSTSIRTCFPMNLLRKLSASTRSRPPFRRILWGTPDDAADVIAIADRV